MLTDIYKELLLKYITGKINEEGTSPQTLINLDRKDMSNNIRDEITNRLNDEFNITNMVILGKIYSNQYENFIVYGNYYTSTNSYGYVCIVNRNLEIVSLLTRYVSGTLIYPLISVRQSETGQFYGLTYGTNGSDADYRIVLFNNILSSGILDGNYQVILRQTYIIPNSPNYRAQLFRQNRIIKSLDSAIYYVIIHTANNQTTVIKFTIDIMEGNKWETFEIPYLIDTVQFDVLLDKSSGDEILYLYGIDILSSPNKYRAYQIQDIMTEIDSIDFSGEVSATLSQVFAYNKDEIYISVGSSTNRLTTLYKVNNSALTTINSFNWLSNNQSYLYLEDVNGTIFYKKKNTNTSSAEIIVGLLINDNLEIYTIEETAEVTNANYDYNDFYIFVQYNLVSMYIPYKGTTDGTYMLVADYNPNNYNGMEYENINSLLPVKGRILTRYGDASDPTVDFVFARNLYNKYVRGNVTVSTLEVPNTLLNNINLFYIGLIGATNYYLASNFATLNGDDIVKNIYETLDINFYNTIRMTDANGSESIENINGATKLNQSVSALLDYHNTQATKARINFTDGTSSIVTIDPSSQITINQDSAYYDFVIYVPSNKSVKNLEIISYDELMVYATINGNFTVGAFNEITQTVSVF